MHPDHKKHLPRINRVIGQLDGIKKMIDNNRYCPDIMVQLKAVSSAVKSIETQILKTHLEHCIKDVFNQNNKLDQKDKINELLNLLKNEIFFFFIFIFSSFKHRSTSFLPGGVTLMQMNDNDFSNLHLHYSPKINYSIGLKIENNRIDKWTFAGIQYNNLLKRINKKSQANFI